MLKAVCNGRLPTVQSTALRTKLVKTQTASYDGLNLVFVLGTQGPPLWSSGQSSWLKIRRPGFDSRHYQKKKVVGLERGALSLVSTN
jgi:hypothetical protein